MLSESQKGQLEKYRLNNYKVVVSNDYDSLVDDNKEYMKDIEEVLPRIDEAPPLDREEATLGREEIL